MKEKREAGELKMARDKDNFELVEDLGIIGRTDRGYTKRLVLAKWYGRPPVYEIRTFTPEGNPGKRAAMTPEELLTLTEILATKQL